MQQSLQALLPVYVDFLPNAGFEDGAAFPAGTVFFFRDLPSAV